MPSKSIDTLVEDIYGVVEGNGGWDATVAKYFKDELDTVLSDRFKPPSGTPRKPTLRMSNLGQACGRKLWYNLNVSSGIATPFEGSKLLSFLYGDILEALLIALAKAAGHEVWGEQDEFLIDGIKGHRDCVIDGVTIDIKTASNYSFKTKFKNGLTLAHDDFGYLSQLSSYVYADTDPKVSDTYGAFLVMDKSNGEIVLDLHNLSDFVEDKEAEIKWVKALVKEPLPPKRVYNDKAEGASGNRVLDKPCVWCEYKQDCWGKIRTFEYAYGPKHFTKVVKLPKVPEVK